MLRPLVIFDMVHHAIWVSVMVPSTTMQVLVLLNHPAQSTKVNMKGQPQYFTVLL